jgi:hypothetical protein
MIGHVVNFSNYLQIQGYKEKLIDIREEILRKRRAGKLPGDTTSTLKTWWQSHSKWPYPTVSADRLPRQLDSSCHMNIELQCEFFFYLVSSLTNLCMLSCDIPSSIARHVLHIHIFSLKVHYMQNGNNISSLA